MTDTEKVLLLQLSDHLDEASGIISQLLNEKNSDYAVESTSSDGSGSVIQYDEALKESSSGMIIGKQGRKLIWDKDVVSYFYLEDKHSASALATKAGVSNLTMTKYLKESGLAELRKKQQEKNAAKFSRPSTKLTEYQQSMYQSNIRTCPVCGKQFSPAPQHIYKDKKGRLCCNYTCARKGGWNG